MSQDHWFIKFFPKPDAALKLICFPYAGGNASTFHSWVNWLPDNVELVGVQLPGRSTRIFEPAFSNMDTLIEALMGVIPKELNKPYILFGHSMGSRVAFQLMDQLKKNRLRLPTHFIASGSRAPHIQSSKPPIYNLPDKDFIAELQHLNGTPEEILNNNELMALFLPLLKADFKLAGTYCYQSNEIFSCPLSILSGKEDTDITLTDLQHWNDFFTHPAKINLISGDHFFIDKNKASVAQKITEIIQAELKKITTKTNSTSHLMPIN